MNGLAEVWAHCRYEIDGIDRDYEMPSEEQKADLLLFPLRDYGVELQVEVDLTPAGLLVCARAEHEEWGERWVLNLGEAIENRIHDMLPAVGYRNECMDEALAACEAVAAALEAEVYRLRAVIERERARVAARANLNRT